MPARFNVGGIMTNRKLLIIAALSMVLPSAAPAETPAAKPKAKPTLIVFNIAPERGVDKGLSNLLTELVSVAASKKGRFTVMGQKELDKMLSWEQQKQLQGCSDTQCLVQIAGAMGAAFYLEGSVGNIGDMYVLTLKLIDAFEVKVVKRGAERVKKDEKELMGAVDRLVNEVLGEGQAVEPVAQAEEKKTAANISGDGVWTDGKTGMVWQNPPPAKKMNWQEAVDYCKGLKLAGKTGWRMPDKQELESLLTKKPNSEDCFWPEGLAGECRFYWTSTAFSKNEFNAWHVLFSGSAGAEGRVRTPGGAGHYSKTYSSHVRCVLGGT
jgi:TolB-like protein